jgi:hypothetical protein
MRVYSIDKESRRISPPDIRIPRPRGAEILPRDFLEGGWDLDVLSEEGLRKMQEIVGDIFAQPEQPEAA